MNKEKKKKLGIGSIAYNWENNILAKISNCIIGYSPLVTEALAIEEALELALHCG